MIIFGQVVSCGGANDNMPEGGFRKTVINSGDEEITLFIAGIGTGDEFSQGTYVHAKTISHAGSLPCIKEPGTVVEWVKAIDPAGLRSLPRDTFFKQAS